MPARLRPVLLVAALLGVLVAGSAPAQEAASGPTTVDELATELDTLTQRLDALVELASRHPRQRELDKYLAYQPEDFEDRRREVRAKDLVDLMSDTKYDPPVPLDLRQAAKDALLSKRARAYDPDLATERGRTKPLNEFAMRYVIELLYDRDPYTRKLAHDLLTGWFPNQTNPAIRFYQPRDGTRKDWKDAYDAWRDILRR